MKAFVGFILAALFLAAGAGPGRALELDPKVLPEINLGGRAVVTGNYENDDLSPSGDDDKTDVDLSDSNLTVGFAKYLFSDVDYGFATVGFKLPDDDSDLDDDIFVHQLQAGIGGPNSELMLGRSRLPTATLLQFPTARDDDLLEFTHVGNGSSNRNADEDTIYGAQIRGTLYLPGTNVFGLAALTARPETDVTDLSSRAKTTSTDLNGLSLALAYDVPEAIKFDRGVRYAGVALDVQRLDELSGTGTETMPALLAGLSYNLSENPERPWALDLQGIYNFGASAPNLDDIATRARSESVAATAALRYANRPYLQSRWQAAVIFGYKDYRGFDQASAFAVAPSFAYRVGSGVELLAQYRFIDRDRALASGTGVETSHGVFLGLSFAFDATFNETVAERRSILFLEHDILDTGPIVGGH